MLTFKCTKRHRVGRIFNTDTHELQNDTGHPITTCPKCGRTCPTEEPTIDLCAFGKIERDPESRGFVARVQIPHELQIDGIELVFSVIGFGLRRVWCVQDAPDGKRYAYFTDRVHGRSGYETVWLR